MWSNIQNARASYISDCNTFCCPFQTRARKCYQNANGDRNFLQNGSDPTLATGTLNFKQHTHFGAKHTLPFAPQFEVFDKFHLQRKKSLWMQVALSNKLLTKNNKQTKNAIGILHHWIEKHPGPTARCLVHLLHKNRDKKSTLEKMFECAEACL